MIEMDKEYQTRDGREVRVLCVDAASEAFPVIFEMNGGAWQCGIDGKLRESNDSDFDLIEKPQSVTQYANVYPSGTIGRDYPALEKAKYEARPASLGVIKYTITGKTVATEFIPKEKENG